MTVQRSPPLDDVARRLLEDDIQLAFRIEAGTADGNNSNLQGGGDTEAEFHRFQNLPPELRADIYGHAMNMEKPQLIHVTARPISISNLKHPRPRLHFERDGRFTIIHGKKYFQAPSYFFVNQECRYWATRFYDIRFTVEQAPVPPLSQCYQNATNILMGPNDIFVPWYLYGHLTGRRGIDVTFEPGASRVRNILINPWSDFTKRTPRDFDLNAFYMAARLILKMGNIDAIEKLIVLCGNFRGQARYVDCHRRRYMGECARAAAHMDEDGKHEERDILRTLPHVAQFYFMECEKD